jgi:eukaryotic-like serine/threonine-protein kinase
MPITSKRGSPVRFGKYVLLERLGSGGMAEAFKAVAEGARGFRRIVVVKRILPHLASNVELAEMFSHEARICALLSHPNVVQIHDFGEADGTLYIAMEYLNGEPLLWVLERLGRANERLPLSVVGSIAHQVASGLDYAHRLHGPSGEALGIVHRDIKPANVMLLFTGTVKILDFGIARAANVAGPPATTAGTVRGSLGYQAPEQLLGAPADPRSDVFSVGVMLWEMLTNRRLFFCPTEALIHRKILEEPVPPPSSRRPELPMALESITMRALQRSPEDRYPTAGAMAADLEQWLGAQALDSQEMPRIVRALHAERYDRPEGDRLRSPAKTLWVGPSAETEQRDPALLVPEALRDTPLPPVAAETAAPAFDGLAATQKLARRRRPTLLLGGGISAAAAVLVAALIFGSRTAKPPAAGQASAPAMHRSLVPRAVVAEPRPAPLPTPAAAATIPAVPSSPGKSLAAAAGSERPLLRRKGPRSAAEARAGRRTARAAAKPSPTARPATANKILNAEPENPFE